MAKTRWTSKKRKGVEDSDFQSPPPQSSSSRMSPRLKKKKVEEAGTEASPIRLSIPVSKTSAKKMTVKKSKEKEKKTVTKEEKGWKLLLEFEENEVRQGKINFFGHIDSCIGHIKAKLSERQQEMFSQTCFGHFLKVKQLASSAQILNHLVMRVAEVHGYKENDKVFFEICGKLVSFSIEDMVLITDLWCDGDTNEKFWKTKGSKHIGLTYFTDNNTLKRQSIKIVFDLVPTQNDEDRVKVALLYFLASGLLTNSPGVHLPRFYVDLVDDLESFNKYLWGKLLWDETSEQIRLRAGNEVKKEKGVNHYNIFGFPMALQIWSYETTPLLGQVFAIKEKKTESIPRILRWSTDMAPSAEVLQKSIFSNPNVSL